MKRRTFIAGLVATFGAALGLSGAKVAPVVAPRRQPWPYAMDWGLDPSYTALQTPSGEVYNLGQEDWGTPDLQLRTFNEVDPSRVWLQPDGSAVVGDITTLVPQAWEARLPTPHRVTVREMDLAVSRIRGLHDANPLAGPWLTQYEAKRSRELETELAEWLAQMRCAAAPRSAPSDN